MGKEKTARAQIIWSGISLLAASGTLICCVLPAIMVALGAGAVLASWVSAAPWLVTLSAHKGWVFSLSATMLVLAGLSLWRARYAPCPIDPIAARQCARLRRLSWLGFGLGVVMWLVGFFMAFLAVRWF